MAIGDNVVFNSNVTAGLTPVHCSWDFDQSDGVQEDAVGSTARHKYTKQGDYVVTLTATDVYGIKAKITQTIKVHIE